ncbi:MAG: hypothetical protein RMY16_31805 [Nostoc sp. DedQUE12b]|uniref:hypothetical protein n=1 Tax=Nostoc sp. DedQUE12b TaxID=3075398 RepID=UPI002AD28E35|nr:hypothetical protein [Nostoc sp. DedQUE12b]MDZ8090105.1 hypothetical protein [Nostoc sp. DedQUE12b]
MSRTPHFALASNFDQGMFLDAALDELLLECAIIVVVTQIRTVLIAQSLEKTGFLLSTQHLAIIDGSQDFAQYGSDKHFSLSLWSGEWVCG